MQLAANPQGIASELSFIRVDVKRVPNTDYINYLSSRKAGLAPTVPRSGSKRWGTS